MRRAARRHNQGNNVNLNNLKIGQKLALSFGAVLLLSAIMAVISTTRISALGDLIGLQIVSAQYGSEPQAANSHALIPLLAMAGLIVGSLLGIVATRRIGILTSEAAPGRLASRAGAGRDEV